MVHTCDCGSDGLKRLATDDVDGRAEPGKPSPPPKPEVEVVPNMLPVPGGGGNVRFCCSPEPGTTAQDGM